MIHEFSRKLVPYIILSALLLSTAVAVDSASPRNVREEGAEPIYFGGDDLQQVIDGAAPYTRIIFNPNEQLTITESIKITKPLWLQGFNARLPDGLGGKSILEIWSKDVSVTDFQLTGNADTVTQSERAALLTIYAGDFRIEGGKLFNSSKDGIEVDQRDFPEPIEGGVIRDIVGRGCMRDVISLGGPAGPEPHNRNLLVENIRGYDSSKRGAVEVSDGCFNVTVRKVYAENCEYAIDVQDHNKKEINRNISISDVYALRCTYALRTANNRNGHTILTLENITAEDCKKTSFVRNTSNLNVNNVRVVGYSGRGAAFVFSNCDSVTLRDFSFIDCKSKEEGLLLKNCSDVTIDGLRVIDSGSLTSGVTYRITGDKTFGNLFISHVNALNVSDAGIILERNDGSAVLSNYIISNNVATITDGINGKSQIIDNNLSKVE